MPDTEQMLFEALSLEVSKSLVSTIRAVTEVSQDTRLLPKSNQRSFMTALLIQQADMLHELIGFMLSTEKRGPGVMCSKELKLLAALTAHYAQSGVSEAYSAAICTVDKLGHTVPERLIKP